MYKAAVVSTLLFGCEAWTLTRANIKRLEMFHQTSLRRIARIQWFHKKTNYEVLRECKIDSMQCMIEGAILRWSGHVARMRPDRTPKLLLYGRLATGRTSRGNHLTHRNQVRQILRACDIRPSDLETHAADRDGWRVLYKDGIKRAEYDRIDHLVTRRERRHIRAGRIQSHQPA